MITIDNKSDRLLSDLCIVEVGFQFREGIKRKANGNVEIIQMKDIDTASYRVNPDHLDKTVLSERKTEKFKLSKSDLVIASKGNHNIAAVVEFKGRKAVAGPNLIVIRPKMGVEIYPEYLAWFINSPIGQYQIEKNRSGSYIRLIRKQDLLKMKIVLPPEEVQRKIIELFKLKLREKSLIEQIVEKRSQLINETIYRYINHSNLDYSPQITRNTLIA